MGLKRKEIIEQKHTDATALPENVGGGYIFYNNDGRQIGTGVIVGDDANTTPSDVAKGKVFYSKDGRRVGEGNMLKKASFVMPDVLCEVEEKSRNYIDIRDNQNIVHPYDYEYQRSFNYVFRLDNVSQIVYLKVDNIKIYAISGFDSIYIFEGSYQNGAMMVQNGGKYYNFYAAGFSFNGTTQSEWAGKTIEIAYI